ncbi:MAG: EamA family transporter [Deltaproteobacteria bacterium]|nr:EamA family transporter [Deltaproteobacteria bacterium]
MAFHLGPTVALVCAAILVAAGQILLKQAVLGRTVVGAGDLLALLINPWALAGLAVYGLGTVGWLYGLSHLPFYVVTFFMALPLVLVLLAAILLFGERPDPIHWVGIAAVTAGVILVTWKR